MAPLPPIIDPVDSRDEAAGGGRSSAAAPKLSVVIPVYNEEAVLPVLLSARESALSAELLRGS